MRSVIGTIAHGVSISALAAALLVCGTGRAAAGVLLQGFFGMSPRRPPEIPMGSSGGTTSPSRPKRCAKPGSRPSGSPRSGLSITHIFSGALPLVNLGQFCDLANPHQDSFGNGAHDLTQYCLGPSSGFGG